MVNTVLDADAYRSALGLRDLTDAAAGPHAMQLIVADAVMALCKAWGCSVVVHRQSPIVTVDENYNRTALPICGSSPRCPLHAVHHCDNALAYAHERDDSEPSPPQTPDASPGTG